MEGEEGDEREFAARPPMGHEEAQMADIAATTQDDGEESEPERLNRELDQLLGELRVAMPGVQVLFAFLLAVPFQQRFAQATDFQRDVYFVRCWQSAAAWRSSSRRPPITA